MTREAWKAAEKPMTDEEREAEAARVIAESHNFGPSTVPPAPPIKKRRRRAGPQNPD